MKKVRLGELLRTNGFVRRDKSMQEISYYDTSSVLNGVVGSPKLLSAGIDKIPSRAQNAIEGDTVIYSLVRPSNQHHAYLRAEDLAENSVFSTGYCGIKAKGKNNLYYLYLLLTSEQSLMRLSQIADTSTSSYPSINPADIEDIIVDYHDNTDDQQKLACFGTTIERLISNIDSQISELEQTAQDLYDYWFVQFDFPDQDGKPYRSSGGKMVWNQQIKRKIPYKWSVRSISDIADIVNGGTPPTKNPSNYDGDILWLTPKDLSGQSMKFTDASERSISKSALRFSTKRLLPEGTILLTSRAPIGLVSISRKKCATNQGFKNIIASPVIVEYLYYKIKELVPYLNILGSGTTFREISKSDLGSVLLPLPDEKTLNSFHVLTESLFESQYKLQQKRSELIKTRDFLLPLLLNGQVSF